MKAIILFCMICSLCSCAIYKQEAIKNQQISACHHTCQNQLQNCLKICHNNRRDCSVFAFRKARKNYLCYQHEQMVQGKDVTRELKSFRDPLQCEKTTCECLAEVRVCRQFCAGKIRKRLQVVPPPC